MNKIRKVLLAAAFLFSGVTFINSASAQGYDSLLRVLDTRYPQEKIYLHYDRTFYNPGETIWFKAYLFAANMPSHISKTVYADLIDENGKIIDRKVAPVVKSSAAAAFDLPADLKSSHVYVRAYTEWMLNFDSSFIYQKALPIVQEKKPVARKIVPRNFLQFFPEGGDLLIGVDSRVAFKATDVRGVPYNVSGNIVDSKGKTVSKFETVHNGMGYFNLVPVADEEYSAVWKDAAGKSQKTALPRARKNGVVLRIDRVPTGLQFSITRPADAQQAVEKFTIVGQMQQQLVYMATANVSQNKTVKGVIPTQEIPAGIIQLTLFTAERKPVAERIAFVNKPDYYFITDLNSPLKALQKRARNVIQIDVPDTIPANLSLSITDAGINPKMEREEDIFSNVLLTSDVKGYVHDPAYYFSSEADSINAHLDLVMMTNGWRRFKWEEVLAGKFPSIRQMPQDYVAFKGKVNGLTRTQLASQELTGILEIDDKHEFITIPVDAEGNFEIGGMIFFDTAKMYYQFNNDKEKVLTSRASFDIKSTLLKAAADIRLDTMAAYHTVLPPDDVWANNLDLSEKNLAVMDARRKVQTLEAVTVTGRQKSRSQLMNEEYTSAMFRSEDAYTFIMEDDITAQGSMSVLNYLQGKVAGLQITGMGQQMSMSWRGAQPALFLNEMQADVSSIQNLNMANIAMVKVFRPPFFGAQGGGAGGAIAVYTKKGASAYQDVKGLDFVKIPGYSPVKEFYSPDYSKYDERHADADYRPTLFWNPFVLTDKNSRRILFTFYNNDVTRRFRVVVEGCDDQGRLTRMEKVFE